jgi:hypothetical protein
LPYGNLDLTRVGVLPPLWNVYAHGARSTIFFYCVVIFIKFLMQSLTLYAVPVALWACGASARMRVNAERCCSFSTTGPGAMMGRSWGGDPAIEEEGHARLLCVFTVVFASFSKNIVLLFPFANPCHISL